MVLDLPVTLTGNRLNLYVSSFKILELGDYIIELLEAANLTSLQELHRLEGQWIKKSPNAININIPGRNFNKYNEKGQKIYEYYKEEICNDNILEKAKTKYYYVEYDNENKKATIHIKNEKIDKIDKFKLEYVGLYKDSYLNEEKQDKPNKKDNEVKKEKCSKPDKDMIVNDLKLMLQKKGYEVIYNKKVLDRFQLTRTMRAFIKTR